MNPTNPETSQAIEQQKEAKPKVIYSGHFVKDQEQLLTDVPPRIDEEGFTIHAHHITKEFRPESGLNDIELGKRRTVYAVGQVAVEGVHVVVVSSPDDEKLSSNEHPHITIATAKGVRPTESNRVLKEAFESGTVEPIEPPLPIHVQEGYFDGKNDVTEGETLTLEEMKQRRSEFANSLVEHGQMDREFIESGALDKFEMSPELGDGLRHMLIGDKWGGFHHLPSVVELSIPGRVAASKIDDPREREEFVERKKEESFYPFSKSRHYPGRLGKYLDELDVDTKGAIADEQKYNKDLYKFAKRQAVRNNGSFGTTIKTIEDGGVTINKDYGVHGRVDTMFPNEWSAQEVAEAALAIAQDPEDTKYNSDHGSINYYGTYKDLEIAVATNERTGKIRTAFPITGQLKRDDNLGSELAERPTEPAEIYPELLEIFDKAKARKEERIQKHREDYREKMRKNAEMPPANAPVDNTQDSAA